MHRELLMLVFEQTSASDFRSCGQGAADMGGSGEFTWDLTFTANVLSLLDPTATKEVLRFIIASTDLGRARWC